MPGSVIRTAIVGEGTPHGQFSRGRLRDLGDPIAETISGPKSSTDPEPGRHSGPACGRCALLNAGHRRRVPHGNAPPGTCCVGVAHGVLRARILPGTVRAAAQHTASMTFPGAGKGILRPKPYGSLVGEQLWRRCRSRRVTRCTRGVSPAVRSSVRPWEKPEASAPGSPWSRTAAHTVIPRPGHIIVIPASSATRAPAQ
jgi:hypothetical protein